MAFSVAGFLFPVCLAVVAASFTSALPPPSTPDVTPANVTTPEDDVTTPTETLNATDSNATTPSEDLPSPSYLCYDCNSGSPLPDMWYNQNCNESGYVAPWYTPSPCPTFCFASVGLYPAGTVTRGCATALYLPGQDLGYGCFEDTANQRVVCLCSGDRCNTMDLSQVSEHYVNQHNAMQEAKAAKDANSV